MEKRFDLGLSGGVGKQVSPKVVAVVLRKWAIVRLPVRLGIAKLLAVEQVTNPLRKWRLTLHLTAMPAGMLVLHLQSVQTMHTESVQSHLN